MKYNYSLPSSHEADAGDVEEAEYRGNFKAGKREGHGVITWPDGSRFRG